MNRPLTVAVSGMNAGESPQPGPAIARSLREAPGFTEAPCHGRIVGLLYDAMESGVYSGDLLDAAYVVPYPSSGSDALAARIEHIHARHPIDVILPTLDAELPAYIRLTPFLRELGIRMFLPTEEQLDARSKSRLADFARKIGIDSPRQKLVSSLDLVPSAFAEFNTRGAGAMVKGVFYEAAHAATSADAVKIAAKIAVKWGMPVILQEKILGEEYDLAMVGDGEGGMIGAVAIKKMALTEKGKAFGGMTISDKELFAIGRKFIERTKWRGPLEMEFVKATGNGAASGVAAGSAAGDNKYYLIEINPRFPAWIYLASQVGQNLPWAVVRMALGEEIDEFATYEPGRFFVRHAVDIVADLAMLERLTMEGELQIR
ncbi:MAG: biotin carboxylase [Candidatus Hydrogenedentota bacterium]